jgi:hypothetical protein
MEMFAQRFSRAASSAQLILAQGWLFLHFSVSLIGDSASGALCFIDMNLVLGKITAARVCGISWLERAHQSRKKLSVDIDSGVVEVKKSLSIIDFASKFRPEKAG